MFWKRQRNCYHTDSIGIYGDAINFYGFKRGYCFNCGALLDELPPRLRSVEIPSKKGAK